MRYHFIRIYGYSFENFGLGNFRVRKPSCVACMTVSVLVAVAVFSWSVQNQSEYAWPVTGLGTCRTGPKSGSLSIVSTAARGSRRWWTCGAVGRCCWRGRSPVLGVLALRLRDVGCRVGEVRPLQTVGFTRLLGQGSINLVI